MSLPLVRVITQGRRALSSRSTYMEHQQARLYKTTELNGGTTFKRCFGDNLEHNEHINRARHPLRLASYVVRRKEIISNQNALSGANRVMVRKYL